MSKYIQYMYMINQNLFAKDKDFIMIHCLINPVIGVVSYISLYLKFFTPEALNILVGIRKYMYLQKKSKPW